MSEVTAQVRRLPKSERSSSGKWIMELFDVTEDASTVTATLLMSHTAPTKRAATKMIPAGSLLQVQPTIKAGTFRRHHDGSLTPMRPKTLLRSVYHTASSGAGASTIAYAETPHSGNVMPISRTITSEGNDPPTWRYGAWA